MSNQVVNDFARKLGIDEKNIQSKANELLRLLKQKPISKISENAQIVICLNIAANFKNYGIQEDDAFKFAQLTKKKYNQEKRLIEKLLNIENVIGVRDLCTQLGIEKVIPTASELHQKCCENLKNSNMDSNHPQYLAMAVYQAAKCMKVSVSKVQLRECAQMTGPQWTKLEQLWQKWALSVDEPKTKTKMNSALIYIDANEEITQEQPSKPKTDEIQTESYECWKQRMLDMAYHEREILEELYRNKNNSNMSVEEIIIPD